MEMKVCFYGDKSLLCILLYGPPPLNSLILRLQPFSASLPMVIGRTIVKRLIAGQSRLRRFFSLLPIT
jgi:hypothetical protein